MDATKYNFTNRVVNVWNSLPSHIVSSTTLSTFKTQLQKHDFFLFVRIYNLAYVFILVVFFIFNYTLLVLDCVILCIHVSCTTMAVLVTILVLLLLLGFTITNGEDYCFCHSY